MGMVFDIKRGSIKDGPGLRTSVFLKGCPLRCVWCHNPESQSPEPQRAVTTGEICGREMSVDEVMDEVLADKPFYGVEGGMTLTGGEPLLQADFALALATAAKRESIHVAVDTCGQARWESFEQMLPVTGLFLYDLKCMDPVRHKALTGVDNALILDNLRRLDAVGAKIWIRCPLVPGLNDSDADLKAIVDEVSRFKNVQRLGSCPYHPIGLEKYAKFGIPVRFDRREEATKTDFARWNKMIKFEKDKR